MQARELPMFPLETVLFPHATIDLHVFEPRYQAMVKDLLAGDRAFGIVLIERGRDVGGGDARFDVGTLSRLVRCDELSHGHYSLTAVGVSRIKISEWLPEEPYPRALVVEEDERTFVEDDSLRFSHALSQLLDLLALYEKSSALGDFRMPSALDMDIATAAFQLCQLAPLGPIDAQGLLHCESVEQRLTMLSGLLEDQIVMLRSGLADS